MAEALTVIGLFHLFIWTGLALLAVLEPPRRRSADRGADPALGPPTSLDERRPASAATEQPRRRAA
jgi:hypothetical protein